MQSIIKLPAVAFNYHPIGKKMFTKSFLSDWGRQYLLYLLHLVYFIICYYTIQVSATVLEKIRKNWQSRLGHKFYGWGYTHDGRADKYPYPHDRRADKDSYPHDRNVTDDLCSLIKLCFAFNMVLWLNFQLNVFYCYSCWKLFTLNSAWIIKKCITDVDQSVKNRRLITAQVIKIKIMRLCICIITFSVIIVSNYQIVI